MNNIKVTTLSALINSLNAKTHLIITQGKQVLFEGYAYKAYDSKDYDNTIVTGITVNLNCFEIEL